MLPLAFLFSLAAAPADSRLGSILILDSRQRERKDFMSERDDCALLPSESLFLLSTLHSLAIMIRLTLARSESVRSQVGANSLTHSDCKRWDTHSVSLSMSFAHDWLSKKGPEA